MNLPTKGLWVSFLFALLNQGTSILACKKQPQQTPEDTRLMETTENELSGNDQGLIGDEEAFSFAVDPELLWPRGIVYYEIDSKFSKEQKMAIGKSMNYIISNLHPGCIQFRPRKPSDMFYVYIQPHDSLCQSTIGRKIQSRMSTIDLQDDCFESPGTVLHELIHTLGAAHEHIRPDRNLFLEVDCDGIENRFKKSFTRKVNRYDKISSTPYDLRSVMHYRKKEIEAASKDKNNTVLKVREAYAHLSDLSEDPPLELTATDIMEISRNYDCGLKPGIKEKYVKYVNEITIALLNHLKNNCMEPKQDEDHACYGGYVVASKYVDEWNKYDDKSNDYQTAKKMLDEIFNEADQSNIIFTEEIDYNECP